MYPLASFQALVIGASRYEHYEDLPETVNDARSLVAVLIDPRHCGYPSARVHPLREDTATRKGIMAGLERLADEAVDDATTLVYFSGHGGHPEGDLNQVYLCPTEADPNRLDATAISSETFSAALNRIRSRRVVVILDTCHASGAAVFKGGSKGVSGSATWTSTISPGAYEQLNQGSGRVFFASSRRDQLSWTYPSGHMSLFTYYLLDGLKGRAATSGDGLIRVFDLFQYVSGAIRRNHPIQEPLLSARDVNDNFPISLYQGGAKGAIALPRTSPIGEIRELIVDRPRDGARVLVAYLRGVPYELLEDAGINLAVVEMKLAELIRIEGQMRDFGEDPTRQVARREIIAYLIDVYRVWDRFER
jgi:metacaspase-1